MVWLILALAAYYSLATGSLHSAWLWKSVAIFPCSNGTNPRKNVASRGKKIELVNILNGIRWKRNELNILIFFM